jgi:hypothetical protein
MATTNANLNYDPNARYDQGPASAGSGRVSNQAALQAWTTNETGLGTDAVLGGADLRCGFNCAGNLRANTGPNVAGAQRSVNGH